jgi:hypothetical protein
VVVVTHPQIPNFRNPANDHVGKYGG